MYKRFALVLLATPTMLLLFMAVINVLADPAEIYRVDSANDVRWHYVAALQASEHGLIQQGNERLVKREWLVQAADADCVVLGSSRAAQFSVLRGPAPLFAGCRKLANLWVSATTLEDIWLINQQLEKHLNRNSRIFWCIDPWLYTPHLNTKYTIYQPEAPAFFKTFPLAIQTPDRLTNVINLDYFKVSWKTLTKNWSLNAYPVVAAGEKFSAQKGAERDVLLADGSLVYPRKDINRPAPIPGDATLHQHVRTINPHYAGVMEELLASLAQRFDITLVLAPYHPHTQTHPALAHYLKEVQTRIQHLGKMHSTPVVGSYVAADWNCTAQDFFDYLHPRFSCLQQIR